MSFCLTNYLSVGRRDELFDRPLSVTRNPSFSNSPLQYLQIACVDFTVYPCLPS
jgi:hypothetical protein